MTRARRIIVDQALFTQPASQSFNPVLFARSEEFLLALQLFGLRMDARGQGMQLYEGWKVRREEALAMPGEEFEQLRRKSKSKRRRRRRRTRKRGFGDE